MGSHGGATAEGQRELIARYGVTEEAMGCPIRSSMDTVHLGEVEGGVPVWFDRNAYGADAGSWSCASSRTPIFAARSNRA